MQTSMHSSTGAFFNDSSHRPNIMVKDWKMAIHLGKMAIHLGISELYGFGLWSIKKNIPAIVRFSFYGLTSKKWWQSPGEANWSCEWFENDEDPGPNPRKFCILPWKLIWISERQTWVDTLWKYPTLVRHGSGVSVAQQSHSSIWFPTFSIISKQNFITHIRRIC